jgi:hypothetical protein
MKQQPSTDLLQKMRVQVQQQLDKDRDNYRLFLERESKNLTPGKVVNMNQSTNNVKHSA